jgi:predicted HTH domain antitoxin
MKTLHLNVRDTVEFDEHEAKMAVAARLYSVGKLSLGQGAAVVGLSKQSFMGSLGDYGVSVFNYSPDDLERDFQTARRFNSLKD